MPGPLRDDLLRGVLGAASPATASARTSVGSVKPGSQQCRRRTVADLHRDSLPEGASGRVRGCQSRRERRVGRLRGGRRVRDDDVAGRDAAADELVAPRAHLVVAGVVAPRRPGGDDGPDGQCSGRHQRGDVPHTCHPDPLRRPRPYGGHEHRHP